MSLVSSVPMDTADAIRDLREAIAEREGSAFSLRSFHDRFLSFGAIPVALIGTAESMTGTSPARR